MTRIREIREGDCGKNFETGIHEFDFDRDGKKLDLSFYYERGKSGKYESYVLEERGEILGLLCIQNREDCLYLSRIGVKKGHTGKGYGFKLMMFVLQKTGEYNKKIMTCKAREEVWEFFESMGFKKKQVYYDPHWGKSALMELKLKD